MVKFQRHFTLLSSTRNVLIIIYLFATCFVFLQDFYKHVFHILILHDDWFKSELFFNYYLIFSNPETKREVEKKFKKQKSEDRVVVIKK